MEEEKKKTLPQQPEIKEEPIEETPLMKSDPSLTNQVEGARKFFRGAMRGISDPWGAITNQDWGRPSQELTGGSWQDQAEAQMSAILGTYPDAIMDMIGTFGGEWGAIADNVYDDVTRMENPNIQKARGIASILYPTLSGASVINGMSRNMPRAQRIATQLGANGLLDGTLNYAHDVNEGEENTAQYLAEAFPGWWGQEGRIPIPKWMKTYNGMTPEQRRIYHFWENSALSGIADSLAFAVEYRKPVMSWFKPLGDKAAFWKRSQIVESIDKDTANAVSGLQDQILAAEMKKAEINQALATKRGKAETRELNKQLKNVDQAIINAKAGETKLLDEYTSNGFSSVTESPLEASLDAKATSREIQAEEVAFDKLDAGVQGYDADITPGLSNDANRVKPAMTPGNVAENMIDVTSNKLGATKGDNVSIVTDNMYSKGFRLAKGNSRDAVEGFAKQAEDMGDWEAIKNGFRYTREVMDDAAWNVYNDIITSADVQDVKKLFAVNEDFVRKLAGETRQRSLIEPIQQVETDARAQFYAMQTLIDKFIGKEVTLASARTMDTLGREIATAAEGVNYLGKEAVDENKAMEIVLDKLEFLMTEYGINKYISGWMLRNKAVWDDAVKRGEDLAQLPIRINEEFTKALDGKHKAAMNYRNILKEAMDEDPDLARGFIEAFSLTDGDVDSIAKMHDWAWKQIRPMGAIHSKATKGKMNLLARGLKTIRFNNVLSGKATLNAAKGSVTSIVGKTLRAHIAGGMKRFGGDKGAAIEKASYLYGAIFETNKRALADGWNMMKRVHHDPKSMMKAFRKDYVIKEERTWEGLDAIAKTWEKNGETGKAHFYKVAKGLNKIGQSRWYRAAMTGMTGIDAYTNTMMAHYWSRAKAYEEIGKKYGWPFTQIKKGKPSPELLEAEKKIYGTMFDKEGLPKDEALKYFSGEVNLNLDNDFADAVTRATDAVPAIQGMFLFPRTGLNDVMRKTSYLPLQKIPGMTRYTKILTAGSDKAKIAEALAEHGIPNMDAYPDAMNFYKYLKEEYEARLAWSGMLGSTLMSMALGGYIINRAGDDKHGKHQLEVVGTGNFDHQRRRKERDFYKIMPKSVTFPGTDVAIPYNGIEGLDPILSLYGDMAYYYNDLSGPVFQDLFDKSVWAISANFLNETPLAGLEPLVAFTQGDSSWISRFVANEARSFIPLSGALGVTANAIDSAFKDIHGDALAYVTNKMPLLKNNLPDHISIFDGKPVNDIENPILRSFNAGSPSPMSARNPDWMDELYKIGWMPHEITNTDPSGHYVLSGDERAIVNKLIADTGWAKKAKKYVENPYFQKEVAELRKLRLTNRSWSRIKLKEKDLPIFQYLNAELRNAQNTAFEVLKVEYPAMWESIRDSIAARQAMLKGKPNEAAAIADRNEKAFKKIDGILQYANPPKNK